MLVQSSDELDHSCLNDDTKYILVESLLDKRDVVLKCGIICYNTNTYNMIQDLLEEDLSFLNGFKDFLETLRPDLVLTSYNMIGIYTFPGIPWVNWNFLINKFEDTNFKENMTKIKFYPRITADIIKEFIEN